MDPAPGSTLQPTFCGYLHDARPQRKRGPEYRRGLGARTTEVISAAIWSIVWFDILSALPCP